MADIEEAAHFIVEFREQTNPDISRTSNFICAVSARGLALLSNKGLAP